MRLFTVLLVAAPFLAVCTGQAAVILEHPQTQYVLVGNTATFHCKTLGQDAFWSINERTISETHLDIKREYESLGFTFTDSTHGTWGYHNLTINARASERLNNTKIECTIVDRNFFQIGSNIAYLYVFTDLRPYPPQLIEAAVMCGDLLPPQFHGSVQVQPRWTGYDITELRINITDGSNGEILKQATIPYRNSDQNFFNATLPGCVVSLNINSSILVSATAFSSAYGESISSPAIEAIMDGDPGNFSEQAIINHTVFYYPNGTPFLYLVIKLPSTLCSCQKVAYTIEIEDINTGQVEIQDPFYHNTMEHKLHIAQDIVSAIFQRDNNYTMTVTMETFGETSTSKRYFFDTILRLLPSIPRPKPCNTNTRDDNMTFYFQLGIGTSLLITVVVMAVLVIIVITMYMNHKREQTFIYLAARRVRNTNPVYDMPVYESIRPAASLSAPTTDSQHGSTGMTHARSGCVQHCQLRETGLSDSLVFQENAAQPATWKYL